MRSMPIFGGIWGVFGVFCGVLPGVFCEVLLIVSCFFFKCDFLSVILVV